MSTYFIAKNDNSEIVIDDNKKMFNYIGKCWSLGEWLSSQGGYGEDGVSRANKGYSQPFSLLGYPNIQEVRCLARTEYQEGMETSFVKTGDLSYNVACFGFVLRPLPEVNTIYGFVNPTSETLLFSAGYTYNKIHFLGRRYLRSSPTSKTHSVWGAVNGPYYYTSVWTHKNQQVMKNLLQQVKVLEFKPTSPMGVANCGLQIFNENGETTFASWTPHVMFTDNFLSINPSEAKNYTNQNGVCVFPLNCLTDATTVIDSSSEGDEVYNEYVRSNYARHLIALTRTSASVKDYAKTNKTVTTVCSTHDVFEYNAFHISPQTQIFFANGKQYMDIKTSISGYAPSPTMQKWSAGRIAYEQQNIPMTY